MDVQVVEDTDERAPEGWVPPVLVSEFEEMDKKNVAGSRRIE